MDDYFNIKSLDLETNIASEIDKVRSMNEKLFFEKKTMLEFNEKKIMDMIEKGEIEVAKNQEAASLEYTSPISSDVTPLDSPRTVEQTSMLQKSNSTAAQVARDYMQNGGNTTVVNAPQTTNNTSTSGGGGSTMIPTVMSDNSSASQAANANI